jgi:hypothetical protein
MTADEFATLALSFPEATQQSHMAHPDFRVRGKIFATLPDPDRSRAMVKLPPDDQDALCRSMPQAFEPVPGGWGRRGATYVNLEHVDQDTACETLAMAWRNSAPESLIRRSGGSST